MLTEVKGLGTILSCAPFWSMALYYFHIFNDVIVRDEEGVDLPDAEAARAMGVAEARNLAAHSITTYGHLFLDHRIEVTDETGLAVAEIEFGDAIEIKRSTYRMAL